MNFLTKTHVCMCLWLLQPVYMRLSPKKTVYVCDCSLCNLRTTMYDYKTIALPQYYYFPKIKPLIYD
jgi:hypothetical protein